MKRFRVYSIILAILAGILLAQAGIHLSILLFVAGVTIEVASLLVQDLAELTEVHHD